MQATTIFPFTDSNFFFALTTTTTSYLATWLRVITAIGAEAISSISGHGVECVDFPRRSSTQNTLLYPT